MALGASGEYQVQNVRIWYGNVSSRGGGKESQSVSLLRASTLDLAMMQPEEAGRQNFLRCRLERVAW